MPLSNMREHGVRSVEATCEDCKHEAIINVDSLPDGLYVPDVALRLRCSACGSLTSTPVVARLHYLVALLSIKGGRANDNASGVYVGSR